MESAVFVPIRSATIIDISAELAQRSAQDSISEFIEKAVQYTLDNLGMKGDDDLPILTRATGGFRWKSVFLPEGTKLRMRYDGQFHYAEVVGDHLTFDGEKVSPSEFTFRVTKTSRNAWRDIEVQRPSDGTWVLADKLR